MDHVREGLPGKPGQERRLKQAWLACPGKAALLGLVLWLPSSANEKISVAAFEYPPIYQNGADKGLSGDIVVEAFKAVNIDAALRFLPPQRMVLAVSSGDAVCGIGGRILFEDPEVARNVRIAPVIQYVSQVFFYDSRRFPNGLRFRNLKGLDVRYRIGVLNGSGIMHFLENNGLSVLDRNVNHEGSARQLQAGRIDLWAIVDLAGLMYLNRMFPDEAGFYRYTDHYNLGDVSVVFSRKLDPVGYYEAQFRKGLDILKKNGGYLRLFAKYYGSQAAINRDALADDMKPRRSRGIRGANSTGGPPAPIKSSK